VLAPALVLLGLTGAAGVEVPQPARSTTSPLIPAEARPGYLGRGGQMRLDMLPVVPGGR
jgi:hypothetical protein